MYTNLNVHGGPFESVLDSEFEESSDVFIASGYVSLNIINKYYDNFLAIAENGGLSKLLVGMAFYEGLSANLLDTLLELNGTLESYNSKNGVFVSHGKSYHGKIYMFKNEENTHYYVGSSNFSGSGLRSNVECTLPVNDLGLIEKLDSFLALISNSRNALSIKNAEIIKLGTKKYHKKIEPIYLDKLSTHEIREVDISTSPYFEFDLSRIVDKPKSNLNTYFGKGRLNRSTGKTIARPWFEIELIADRELTSKGLYPKGDLTAYTDDGFVIPMRTQGDYYKNIRSKSSLQIFGMWLKGKMQKKNALVPLTPVTSETLVSYGKNKIKFCKIRDGEYFLSF